MDSTANVRSAFTLHLRLTHACNAACSYCSSWQRDPSERMRLDEFEQCLDGVERFWAVNDIYPTFLNVEYVGGEIMLIPHAELAAMVEALRDRFGSKMTVRDGVQSNLIGSERRIKALFELFGGRIGTSVDHFTDQRQLGSQKTPEKRAKAYRTFFMTSTSKLERYTASKVPGVLTVDNKSLPFVIDEISMAIADQRDLTVRPVFQGGCSIETVSDVLFGDALVEGFHLWSAKGMTNHIEPYVSLLKRRLNPDKTDGFCAWQKDCGLKSLSIEPNGDVYVCQELADTDMLKLGNFISNEFNVELHNQIKRRSDMLEAGCFQCPYFNSCQGGCMQQSLEAGTGMYGKTQWCLSWKRLFKAMDDFIALHGRERVLIRTSHL